MKSCPPDVQRLRLSLPASDRVTSGDNIEERARAVLSLIVDRLPARIGTRFPARRSDDMPELLDESRISAQPLLLGGVPGNRRALCGNFAPVCKMELFSTRRARLPWVRCCGICLEEGGLYDKVLCRNARSKPC